MKIEIEGEFSQDEGGNVYFGGLMLLFSGGQPPSGAPPKLVKAARVWLAEQKSTVEVTVRVRFERDEEGGVMVGDCLVLTNGASDGLGFTGRNLPELAEAARKWAEENPA